MARVAAMDDPMTTYPAIHEALKLRTAVGNSASESIVTLPLQ